MSTQAFNQGQPPRERPAFAQLCGSPWPQTKHAFVRPEPPSHGESGTSEDQFAFLSQAPNGFGVFCLFKTSLSSGPERPGSYVADAPSRSA